MFKRIAATLLTIFIMFCPMRLSAQSTGLILPDDTGSHAYKSWQLFTADLTSTENEITNIAWSSQIDSTQFLNLLRSNSEFGSQFQNIQNAQQTVSLISQITNEDLNKLFLSQQENNIFAQYAWQARIGEGTDLHPGLNEMTPGYYLIADYLNDEVNGLSLIPITDQVISFTAKTLASPIISKWIENGNLSTDSILAQTGEAAPFHIEITLPANVSAYQSGYHLDVQDVMSDSLSLDESSIKVQWESNKNYEPIDPALYQLQTDEHGFNIHFDQTQQIASDINGHLVLDYKALLNTNAVYGAEGNQNTASISYSTDPNNPALEETGTSSSVSVYTLGLRLTKKDEDGNELDNALFMLENDANQYAVTDDNAIVEWTDDWQQATQLTAGSFTLTGLKEGTYRIIETRAPAQYQILKKPITLEIKQNSSNQTSNSLPDLQVYIDGQEDTHALSIEQGLVSISVFNQKQILGAGTSTNPGQANSSSNPATKPSGIYGIHTGILTNGLYWLIAAIAEIVSLIMLVWYKRKK